VRLVPAFSGATHALFSLSADGAQKARERAATLRCFTEDAAGSVGGSGFERETRNDGSDVRQRERVRGYGASAAGSAYSPEHSSVHMSDSNSRDPDTHGPDSQGGGSGRRGPLGEAGCGFEPLQLPAAWGFVNVSLSDGGATVIEVELHGVSKG